MFRIQFDKLASGVSLRIEGRFASHFAAEARDLIELSRLPDSFVVDLSELTFADSSGEDVLRWLKDIGAKFVAESSYPLHLCERLELPLSEEQASAI